RVDLLVLQPEMAPGLLPLTKSAISSMLSAIISFAQSHTEVGEHVLDQTVHPLGIGPISSRGAASRRRGGGFPPLLQQSAAGQPACRIVLGCRLFCRRARTRPDRPGHGDPQF